jgi:hypothetical protein
MSLGNIFRTIAPIAAGAMFGPGGTLLAGSAGTAGSAITAGALTGAGIAALSGDDPLMGAVSGGLGGYGGAGIGEAMRGTAASAVTPTSSTLPSQFQNLSGKGFDYGAATSSYGGAGIAPGNMNPTTLGSGFKASMNDPKAFLSNLGGGSMGKGAAKLGAVGLPAIGQAMVPEYNANPSDDPMSKYDPKRRLNLGMTTGIQNAMMRDSGLRLNQPFAQFNEGGYLETGMGDGVSDDIPSSIDGEQPAALSENEFVIPADVVSGLGNGSSDAGAEQLYAMMDRVRKARTGTEKMGKEINAERLMPA